MKKYILFVDDDENILQGLKRNLRSKSELFDMNFVTSGADAIAEIEKREPDIVITDYKMPGMNGIELLNIIKEKFPDIHRYLLTGQAANEVFNEADQKSHHYLSKPFNSEKIIEIIEKINKIS